MKIDTQFEIFKKSQNKSHMIAHKKYFISAIASMVMVFSPLVALAQQGDASLQQANCFDYYHFGSVQAHISASVKGTVTGVPITFTGTLDNANPYPIVDGTLIVKIFRLPQS